MWPLIIPPIVLVISLGFLVWFLSKKRADPKLTAELLALGQETPSRRFWFIVPREWGLRFLERLLQRLKLVSLKFHNRFQEVANLLRRKREEARGPITQVGEGSDALSFAPEDKQHFWDRWHRRHRANIEPEEVLESTPLSGASPTAPALEAASGTPASSDQSMTSRFGGLKKKVSALTQSEGAEYFVRRKREAHVPPKKLLSEEELIDRIAKNPKDAVSYEELGDYYLASENLEDAKACYRQVIKLLPLNREVKDKVRKLERLLVQRERRKH